MWRIPDAHLQMDSIHPLNSSLHPSPSLFFTAFFKFSEEHLTFIRDELAIYYIETFLSTEELSISCSFSFILCLNLKGIG